ncbi:uncharacterized protein A4U43_C09F2210 [Asparagus officinalis]|uniref:Amino acid transporter transmembrane domain-containing protein n=1 Tax=Asparagus officinalis TaxID=4686 RepID=A0A5P1E9G9_ASPOF|nr:uncharacterized protein A4U43_C09F2210 [Asparagus officinalis]
MGGEDIGVRNNLSQEELNLDNQKVQAEKKLDDWLPITSSRDAKWWYSAFHNVTAMVGAGVLSLPYALAQLGWGPGVAVLILSWIITLYTLWQMVEMHEMVPGKRFDRYHELGQYAFGDKLGLWIVVPQQLVVEVGVNIVYMVTGGKSLKKFHDVVCPDCKSIKLSFFIVIFGSCHFVLSQLPNFNSISGVSLAAAVMSLSYSTIAWAASVHKGQQPNVDYGYKESTASGTTFGFLSIYAMPVFDMIETVLVKKFRLPPGLTLRLLARSAYVAFTIIIGICIPFFGGLLGFFGGFAFAPTTYYLPCIMWLAIKKPQKFSLSWLINWFCIIVGVLLTVLAPIGGLRSIIKSASTYKFFS